MIPRSVFLLTLAASVPASLPAQDTCAVSVAPLGSFRMASGDHVYVDEPQMVWIGNEMFMPARLTFVFRDGRASPGDTVVNGLYTGLRRDSTGAFHFLPVVAPLPHAMWLDDPRVSVQGQSLHTVWIKRDSTAEGERQTLYYDRLEGGRWVSREVIAAGRQLQWGTPGSGLLRLGDTLWLAAVDQESRSLSVFRRMAGNWTEQQLRTRTPPVYVAMGAIRGLMVIAFVAAISDPGETYAQGSVFVMQSDDNGRTWSNPQRLVRSIETNSHDPQVVALSDSVLAVVWSQGALLESDSLMVATTRRGGAWTAGRTFAAPGPFRSFTAVAAPGGFWVAAQPSDRTGPLLLRWQQGSWRDVPMGSRSDVISTPSIATAPDGVLHVLWTQAADPSGIPYTRTATVTGSCRPR